MPAVRHFEAHQQIGGRFLYFGEAHGDLAKLGELDGIGEIVEQGLLQAGRVPNSTGGSSSAQR